MPALPSSRPSGWMLMLLATAQLIIALDATIVFVALPQIGSHLGFSAQQLQWVVSAYTVAFGGFLLLGGRATDLLGKRRMYRVGQSLYALSSLAAVLGGSALLLVLARAVQGVGGALLFPATLALINTHYAQGPQRNRAFAVWSAASAAGLALGALLGGVLTQWWGWEAVFLVNVPLAGGCALAARYWIPADGERSRGRSFDVSGALTVTVGGTLLVFALVQGPEWGWTAPATLGCMLLALALLGLFAWIEHRGRDPLMPLRLLGYRELRMAMVLTAVFMSSFGVQYYFLALYYQQVYGYSVLQAGLAFLPATLVCTLGIWLAERALVKIGLRNTLVSGQLAGALGIALVCLALPTGVGFWSLLPGIFILSLGQGMTWTAMWVAAGLGVKPGEQGVAAGMASTTQQIGGALGLAVLVSLANAGGATGAAQAQGIELALWWSAGIALVGALVALRLRSSRSGPVLEAA
ncbi:MFS transporter [Pseudomonas proteolytica]|nr:MFS transporter [Pseudomonas proteolytica]NMZ11388.1 MFS transporter [Pseudomonas proteolytica]TDR42388.1 EmrB/QacA subfamily drug resistance transporter [Pseudomonas brenneri]